MTGAARYDGIADFYGGVVGDALRDPAAADLLDLLPEPAGLRVLDLACGQGRMSRELARRGADVVAVDVSAAQLERARSAEDADPLGIRYVQADVTSPDALAGDRFDGVVCHFGLSDIDDLGGALGTVSRVLRPGGWFAFSILHPCFPGLGDDAPSSWQAGSGYFVEGWWLAGSSGIRGKVGSNHRMLSTYLDRLVDHGLPVERTAEPQPTEDWVNAKKPGGEPVPVFLVVRCRRARP